MERQLSPLLYRVSAPSVPPYLPRRRQRSGGAVSRHDGGGARRRAGGCGPAAGGSRPPPAATGPGPGRPPAGAPPRPAPPPAPAPRSGHGAPVLPAGGGDGAAGVSRANRSGAKSRRSGCRRKDLQGNTESPDLLSAQYPSLARLPEADGVTEPSHLGEHLASNASNLQHEFCPLI